MSRLGISSPRAGHTPGPPPNPPPPLAHPPPPPPPPPYNARNDVVMCHVHRLPESNYLRPRLGMVGSLAVGFTATILKRGAFIVMDCFVVF